jgi:hypothetical protein
MKGILADTIRGRRRSRREPEFSPAARRATDTRLVSEEFENARLSPRWRWKGDEKGGAFSLTARPGWLRLYPGLVEAAAGELGNILLRALPARTSVVETTLSLFPLQWGEEAGLVVAGESKVSLGLKHDGFRCQIVLRVDSELVVQGDTQLRTLKIRGAFEKGVLSGFGFGENGQVVTIPPRAGRQMGMDAQLGLYANKRLQCSAAGFAEFDYFRFA